MLAAGLRLEGITVLREFGDAIHFSPCQDHLDGLKASTRMQLK
jgi:hypothetical protein